MSKMMDIIDGWKNDLFPIPELETKAIYRLKICVGTETNPPCTMFSTRVYDHCRLCRCPISKKVRAFTMTNKCPIDKWPADPYNVQRA